MKLYDLVIPRMMEKYNLSKDVTICDAIATITDKNDQKEFIEALKYPNGRPKLKLYEGSKSI